MSKFELTFEDMEVLESVANDLDLRVHWDYSGRFMYGERCFALSGDGSMAGACLTLASTLAVRGHTDLLDSLAAESDVREDSLGRGRIVYWPDVVPAEGWEEVFE